MSDELFERRRAVRRYALKFLDYEILSDRGEVIGRGLARTLNVSENGLLLEAGQYFEPGQILRITIGLVNDLVQVAGKVIHSRPVSDELCNAGIMFIEFEPAEQAIYQKHFAEIKSALKE